MMKLPVRVRRRILPIIVIVFMTIPALAQREVFVIARPTANGLTIQTTLGIYDCVALRDGVLGVEFRTGDAAIADTSVAMITGQRPDHPFIQRGEGIFAGPDWEIKISPSPFSMTASYRRQFETVYEGFFNKDGYMGFGFSVRKEKFITGGGMRALPLNIKGKRLQLENRPKYAYGFPAENLNYSIPLFMTGSGYAIYFDNTAKGYADIGKKKKGRLELGSRGGRMAFAIIAGQNLSEITGRFVNLTGFQPLPPIWTFGHLQSRMAYETQAQTDSIANATRAAGFPLDAMIIDLYWFGDTLFNTMGNLDWYQPNWPDPRRMIRDFRHDGIKTILITEPYIVKGSANFEEAIRQGIVGNDRNGNPFVLEKFYFGPGLILDITSQKAREWMWNKYDTLKKQGVAGWWVDLAEPEYHPDSIYYEGGRSEIIHNAYGHLWDKMLYDNYRQHYPHERLFNLNRSGFAGSQRFGVLPWTGDVERSWSGLRAQIPIMLNMGLCGVGYIHSDAGGFALGTKDEELYTRWLQFSTFTPVFRPHGSGIPSEPIFFSQPTQDIVKTFMRLRYALLPYNYSLAYENSLYGWPLARPVFFHSSMPVCKFDEWQYMWGPSLMVAPVVDPGTRKMRVKLPAGKWYDWWTGIAYSGGRIIRVTTPPDRIPVFARGGSFIPMTRPLLTTDHYRSDTIEIHYFRAGEKLQSAYTLYVDDGKDALAIENNRYEKIQLNASETDVLNISVVSNGQAFEGRPGKRILEFFIHGNPPGLYALQWPLTGEGVSVKVGSDGILPIMLTWDNQLLEINILPVE
jgi:oligosaccharide 4-alpha-D-glucosyltransferase